jgi:hypothetical protein
LGGDDAVVLLTVLGEVIRLWRLMAVLAIPSSSLSSLLLLALLVSSKMLLFGMVEEDLIKAEPLVERCEEWGEVMHVKVTVQEATKER